MSDTSLSPDQAGLLHELTEGTWNVCRLLADLALDQGDPDLAAGWRWLAEHRKRPWKTGQKTRTPWQWSCPISGGDLDQYQDWLPRGVMDLLAGKHAYFQARTEANAFRAAARAVGKWLRQTQTGGRDAE